MEPNRKDAHRARQVTLLLRGIINQAKEAGELAADLTDGEMPDEVAATLLLIKPIAKAMAVVADEFSEKLGIVEGLLMPEGVAAWASFARVLSQADVENEIVSAIEEGCEDYQSYPWEPVNQGMARTDALAKERMERG